MCRSYDFERVIDEERVELGFAVEFGELSESEVDFGKVARMVRVGAEAEDEVFFGHFFDGFLGATTVLADDATEVGLKEDAEAVEALEELEVFLDGEVAFGVSEDDLVTFGDEVSEDIFVTVEETRNGKFDEEVATVA